MRQQQCEECSQLWRQYAQTMGTYMALGTQRDDIAMDDPNRPPVLESIISVSDKLDEIRASIVAHEAEVHGRTAPLTVIHRVQGRADRVRRVLVLLGYELSPKAS